MRVRPAAHAIGASILALVWSALFNSVSLEARAQGMEYGPGRDLAMNLVEPIGSLSRGLGLNRPHEWIRQNLRSAGPSASLGGPQLLPLEEEDSGLLQDSAFEAQQEWGLELQAERREDFSRRAIHPDAPLRLWGIGDSMVAYPAMALDESLRGSERVLVDVDSRHSTGLCRPDYFNWEKHLAARLKSEQPDVILAMFGANDGTTMSRDGVVYVYGGSTWPAEYSRRVGRIMDQMLESEAEVYWLGLPPHRDRELDRHWTLLNTLYEQEASRRARVHYVPTEDRFGGPGGYSTYLQDEDGRRFRARRSDGAHFTMDGARWLAEMFGPRLVEDWSLQDDQAAIAQLSGVLHEQLSFLTPGGETQRYHAFVPSTEAAVHHFPVLYMLGSDWSNSDGWRRFTARDLAGLSLEYATIIVTLDGDRWEQEGSEALQPGWLASWVSSVEQSLPAWSGVRSALDVTPSGTTLWAELEQSSLEFDSVSSLLGFIDHSGLPAWGGQRIEADELREDQLDALRESLSAHRKQLPVLVSTNQERLADQRRLKELLQPLRPQLKLRAALETGDISEWSQELKHHLHFHQRHLYGGGI